MRTDDSIESNLSSKSSKRERSPTLSNLSSTPKYNKNEESELLRTIKFNGHYNKYIKFIFEDKVEVYRVKKWNSYQFLVENIKYGLNLKTPRCYSLEFGKTRYLGYEVYRDPSDNKIWEEFPLSEYLKEKWTEKFVNSYKTLLFFRYLMGFKSTVNSFKVCYDGIEHFPISVTETIRTKLDNRSGPDFIISSIKLSKEERETFPDRYLIDPNTELRRLMKSKQVKISRLDIVKFLDKIKKIILNVDSSYLWIVNNINLKISCI